MKTVFLMMTLLLGSGLAYAQEDHPMGSPWKSQASYGEQVGSKAWFGAKNLLLGWTELIQEPMEQKNPLGVVQGLGNTVMNTVGGFLHLLTAPLTDVDVPLPENGVSLFSDRA